MADNRKPSEAEAFKLQFDRLMGQVRVAMPGKITAFDASTQLVSAVPGVQLKTNIDGVIKFVDLPEIVKIPIVIPYGQQAGLLFTIPIQVGDECLLIFSDRDIDNFTNSGEISIPGQAISQNTTTPRSHHLTDAICIPGFVPQTRAVPDYQTDKIEMRDFERKTFISLTQGKIEMTDGDAVWTMTGGKVTLDAPAGIENTTAEGIKETAATKHEITAPQINLTGNITTTGTGGSGGTMKITGDIEQTGSHTSTGDQVAGGISQTGHVHKGVTPGGSNTGGPQ